MPASTLTIRLDADLKREAAEVADYYGLDLPSVTRAFYKQMVNTHRIPLASASEEPNEESLGAVAEGDAFLASGEHGRFSDARSPVAAAMRQRPGSPPTSPRRSSATSRRRRRGAGGTSPNRRTSWSPSSRTHPRRTKSRDGATACTTPPGNGRGEGSAASQTQATGSSCGPRAKLA